MSCAVSLQWTITGSVLCLSRGVERRRSADPPSTNIDYKSCGGGSNGDGGGGGGSNEDFSDASFRFGFPSGSRLPAIVHASRLSIVWRSREVFHEFIFFSVLTSGRRTIISFVAGVWPTKWNVSGNSVDAARGFELRLGVRFIRKLSRERGKKEKKKKEE